MGSHVFIVILIRTKFNYKISCSPGTELGFEPGGGQSMNQKNFKWHGLLKKKKNHGRQNNCILLPKYLSQEGNNMNQNSSKLL